MKRKVLSRMELSRDFESVVSTISPLRHCWLSAAFRGFLRDYAASFGTIWTGSLHKTLHTKTGPTRKRRILSWVNFWRILIAAILAYSLLTISSWAKAESVTFGWYLNGSIDLKGLAVNFIDVTAPDYHDGQEHLTLSGSVGNNANFQAIPVQAACFSSSITAGGTPIPIYICTLTTVKGSFKLAAIKSGYPNAGTGSISLLDANGDPVAGTTRTLIFAHTLAVQP